MKIYKKGSIKEMLLPAIAQAFQKHRELVSKTHAAGKVPKSDYTNVLSDYRASDWVEIGRVNSGNLI